MDPNDPRHGTRAGALVHWKEGSEVCRPCWDAKTRYAKQLQVDQAHGISRRVPLDVVRKHLQRLDEQGMDVLVVHRVSGVSQNTLRNIAAGAQAFVTRPVAAAILAVPVPTSAKRSMPTFGYVPNFGATRRLQALVAIGYSLAQLAPQVGISATALRQIALGRYSSRAGNHIHATTWHAIDAVYRRLHMTPAPDSRVSTQRRTVARDRGWLPPLAWDDIDDPTEKPSLARVRVADRPVRRRPNQAVDEAVVDRFLGGERTLQLTAAERAEALRRWLAAGRSEKSLCDEMGWREGRYTLSVGA